MPRGGTKPPRKKKDDESEDDRSKKAHPAARVAWIPRHSPRVLAQRGLVRMQGYLAATQSPIPG
eukprot:12534478-Prorocentrum_lima.AAC.1